MDLLNKPIVKIGIQFIFFELLFLFLLNTGLIFFSHREIDFIYYANINFHFLMACFAGLNLKYSKLNRFLILLFVISSGVLITFIIYSFFAWPNADTSIDYNYYYFIVYLYIISNSLFLFISIYLFIYILKPFKKLRYHLFITVSVTFTVSFTIYYTFYRFFDVIEYFTFFLNSTNNFIYWANFVILLLFWYEFAKQKHNLSEYMANIIAIYTTIIGLELVHLFLVKNDLIIHNLGQYFTAVLNILMLSIWIIRLHYLQSPQAKENEYYIKNYKVLYGLVEKPRVGVFEQVYHKLTKRIVLGSLILIGIIGSAMFLSNQFSLFISRNILLLLFALIIFIFFAIIYWDKRWFQGIEFLIQKKKK